LHAIKLMSFLKKLKDITNKCCVCSKKEVDVDTGLEKDTNGEKREKVN